MKLKQAMFKKRFYLLILLGMIIGGVAWAKVQANRARAIPPGHQELTLEVGRLERSYLLHVPPTYEQAKPLPLVIMLHGMGGTALHSHRETGWSSKADAEGFIVVYPDATRPDSAQPPSLRKNPQAWNDGSGRFHAAERNIDDVAFITALIDSLENSYSIDPRRIYVTGFSNGASMTFRLGAELADRIAAIAPHSGTSWTEVLSPARAVSVCYLTGTSDTLNPIEGGFPKLAMGGKDQGGRSKPPVSNMIAKWAKVLECADEPIMEEIVSGVRTSRYGQGRDDAEVLCITIEGLGHHWAGGKSQAPEFLVGKNTDKLSATDVIWAFFSRHPAL
jgi:polyhydroxybutyrate depolymerase